MGLSFGSFHGGSKPDYSTNDNSTNTKLNSDNSEVTDSHDVEAGSYSKTDSQISSGGGAVTIQQTDRNVLDVLRDTVQAALSNTERGAAATYAQTAQLAQASADSAGQFKKWALIGGGALLLVLGGAWILTRGKK